MQIDQKRAFLICDDDYLSAQLIGFEIEKSLNASYQIVDTVDAAIDQLESRHFDCLITEIYLPGKTGMQLIQYSHMHHPNVPKLVLSSDLSDDEFLVLHQMGADDFMKKPFNAVELKIRTMKLMGLQLA